VENKHEEFLPLLIKRQTLRMRIDGRGDDWDHCNGYLIVSTMVFIVFKVLVLWELVQEACFKSSFLAYTFSGLSHYKTAVGLRIKGAWIHSNQPL